MIDLTRFGAAQAAVTAWAGAQGLVESFALPDGGQISGWFRGMFAGAVRADGARAIATTLGALISDDGSHAFSVAWAYAGVTLEPDTQHGHAWNPEATTLADLSIPWCDDRGQPDHPLLFNAQGKDFYEWLETADHDGDEHEHELRAAWRAGETKPRRFKAATRLKLRAAGVEPRVVRTRGQQQTLRGIKLMAQAGTLHPDTARARFQDTIDGLRAAAADRVRLRRGG